MRGEEIWCQLFAETAGPDLTGLRTLARRCEPTRDWIKRRRSSSPIVKSCAGSSTPTYRLKGNLPAELDDGAAL
jgi:hypothetical protein